MKTYHKYLRTCFLRLEPRILDKMTGPLLIRMKPWLNNHNLLSFAREPLARGLASGLFCSQLPVPQILCVLAICAAWRGNVIAGFIGTLFTNALTIVPLYLIAFQIGSFILQNDQGSLSLPQITAGSIDWEQGWAHIQNLNWVLVWPKLLTLLVGLLILGLFLAVSAYIMVQILWLWPAWCRLKKMRFHH